MDLPNKGDGKAVPQKKEIKQVVSDAKQVSRPATRRFFDFLLAESPKDLLKRIGSEVLVPRAKAGIEEAFNSFVHGMFWGGGAAPPSQIVRGTVLRGGGINYQGISSQQTGLQQARQALPVQQHSGNYQDLVVPTQESAEILLANMYDLLNEYRLVSVADLYEMAGITPSPSDGSYGWTNLDGSRIQKVRDGYLLQLPRPYLI